MDLSQTKDFNIKTIENWTGYISSRDKTNIAVNVMVRGSQNVYKNIAGNLSVRQGQKRRGEANTAISAVSSEYVWNTSWGQERTVVVANSKLSVVIDDIWYDLLTGLTETRYVFDKWYDETQAKDRLLFVNGTTNLYQWSGGASLLASGNYTTGQVSNLAAIPTAAGSGYLVGDILTITTGGTLSTAVVTSVGTGTILTVSISQAGRGYTVGDILTLNAGDFGTGATVTVATLGAGNSIATVTLTTGGIGYSATKDYNAIGGTGNSAIINAATVSTGGSVTGVSLLTPGSNYTTGAGKATSGGTGTGATLNIITISQGQILKSDTTTTFQQDGFSTSGTILVSGVQYTYQSTVGNYLVGIGSDPSAIVSGLMGLNTVTTYTNTPAANFSADFLKVINNQVYIGSYESRLGYISSATDFSNYIVPSQRIAGSPELLTFDATLKGISVRNGNAHIGVGTDRWAIITFSNITVGSTLTQQTVVTINPVANLAAPYAHEFIDTVGNNIIYLSQDQQVRTFGEFNNSFALANFPSLSQDISTELMEQDFTNGALRCIGDFTYVTLPNTGKVYLYQVRQAVNGDNQTITERLWHSPFIWNLTRIDVIDGEVIGFSNANPQIYDLWNTNQWFDDSPSDEELPYECICALAYNSNGRRQGLQSFDKVFTEGYIAPGTTLNITVNYNYQGSENILTQEVNSIAHPATFFSISPSSLGDSSLGDESLGSGGDETEDTGTSKFKTINQFSIVNCFEYQPIYSSNEVNAEWELLSMGTNTRVESEQDPGFIINK